jgi:predicted DNA binding CopG/RHH family protein
MRAHSRFRAPDPGLRVVPQPADSEFLSIHEVFPADPEPASEAVPAPARTTLAVDAEPQSPHYTLKAHDRQLKCASITVRLSKEECAQLRRRAAEAGLTISAYLRSCSVEAESLRAQVKDTLAQMRAESPKENQVAAPRGSGRWFDWLRRLLWPRSRARRSIARA